MRARSPRISSPLWQTFSFAARKGVLLTMCNPLKSQIKFAIALAGILAVSSLVSLASQAPKKAPVFAQDKSKFTIQLDGQTGGPEEVEISPAPRRWAAQRPTGLQTSQSPPT